MDIGKVFFLKFVPVTTKILTPKGAKIFEKSFEKLVIPFTSYLGDLKNDEQAQLITLLERLNHYHERKNEQNNS